MAAAQGNQYAAKAKQWQMALERALDKRGAGDRRQALDDLAEALLLKAGEGDMTALKELGDRLDGRPAQAVDLAHSGSIGLTGLLETLPIANLPAADPKVD